jgi:riboflavin kinase/FMN adenylyltransferase
LNFDRDIYGQVIEVEFLEKIREEKKFGSLAELKEQLKKDVGYITENYKIK